MIINGIEDSFCSPMVNECDVRVRDFGYENERREVAKGVGRRGEIKTRGDGG